MPAQFPKLSSCSMVPHFMQTMFHWLESAFTFCHMKRKGLSRRLDLPSSLPSIHRSHWQLVIYWYIASNHYIGFTTDPTPERAPRMAATAFTVDLIGLAQKIATALNAQIQEGVAEAMAMSADQSLPLLSTTCSHDIKQEPHGIDLSGVRSQILGEIHHNTTSQGPPSSHTSQQIPGPSTPSGSAPKNASPTSKPSSPAIHRSCKLQSSTPPQPRIPPIFSSRRLRGSRCFSALLR